MWGCDSGVDVGLNLLEYALLPLVNSYGHSGAALCLCIQGPFVRQILLSACAC